MKTRCARGYGESGSTLIEALIGTLLMSIFFVGMNSVLSRTLVNQRYMNSQSIALLEMRERLLGGSIAGVCGNSVNSVPVANYQVPMEAPTCTSPALAGIGVSGQLMDLPANAVPAVSMSWASSSNDQTRALIGGDGVIRVSY